MLQSDRQSRISRRYSEREEFLKAHLPANITLPNLAPGTVKALHEYARFMLTSAKDDSAEWNTPLNELCRAVEFQLSVALGDIPSIDLEGKTLGQKANHLIGLRNDGNVRGRLSRLKINAAYVLEALPERLLELAKIRGESGAVHGGSRPKSATRVDVEAALQIALKLSSSVIPSLARLRTAPAAR